MVSACIYSQGKRFLFRSAASLLTSLASLGPQPVPADKMAQYVRGGQPGVVLCGSHVKLSTRQLELLLKEPAVEGVEVDVSALLQEGGRKALLETTVKKVCTELPSLCPKYYSVLMPTPQWRHVWALGNRPPSRQSVPSVSRSPNITSRKLRLRSSNTICRVRVAMRSVCVGSPSLWNARCHGPFVWCAFCGVPCASR